MKLVQRNAARIYPWFLAVSALAIVLQGLWAGIFLEHDGQRDSAGSWIDVHATGGEVAIFFSGLAAVVAFLGLRDRKPLWIGAGTLTALLVGEAYIGGLIRDNGKDSLTPVHVPLAIAIMALATWLCAHSFAQRGDLTSGATYPTSATAHDSSTARGARSHG
jgi:hypothetical protein